MAGPQPTHRRQSSDRREREELAADSNESSDGKADVENVRRTSGHRRGRYVRRTTTSEDEESVDEREVSPTENEEEASFLAARARERRRRSRTGTPDGPIGGEEDEESSVDEFEPSPTPEGSDSDMDEE